MGCCRSLCTAQNLFVFINIAFAMYSGALLSTAARLAWDPSTYTWFRYLMEAQYRVSLGYTLAAGLWLAALVYIATTPRALNVYLLGVIILAISEVSYVAWMGSSLVQWWGADPRAELARRGLDLVHDLKPALLAMERYRDVAQPVYHMIEEVEARAPNNAVVIAIFVVLGVLLQIAAVILARRLSRARASEKCPGTAADDEDSESASLDKSSPEGGWRKNANLRMYTILDKIF